MPPAMIGVAFAIASATRSRRSVASPRPIAPEPEPIMPSVRLAGHHRGAGFRRRTVEGDRHDAGARGAAMLDARHHLLADEAALVEIDAAELVHVGLVRECVAVDEVRAAARHAERDAMRLVVGGIDERRAELRRRLAGDVRRDHAAQPERGQARVGIAQAGPAGAGAVPDRQHAERFGQILDDHLGAQLVEVEPLHQRRARSARGQSRK